MITRHNYEIWFMDHLDGKLSASQESILQTFLSINPDLAEEFTLIQSEKTELGKDSVTFNSFSLKKNIVTVDHISEANYEEMFIACHENDLNSKDLYSLNAFLNKNPNLLEEFNFLGKIKITQIGEFFPNKERLKKKAIVIPIYRYVAAASVLILLGVGVIKYMQTSEESHSFATMNKSEFAISKRVIGESENVSTKALSFEKATFVVSSAKEPARTIEKSISVNNSEIASISSVNYILELQQNAGTFNSTMPVSSADDAMTFRQVVGKLIEEGMGENGVSEGLEHKEKITGGDVADLAAAPFKNNEMPIISTTKDKRTGRRRVKFNLGFFEADFAVK